MQTQIHGHDVIAMMMESPVPYTRDSLTQAIIARFGAETRFYTCSAEGMSAVELVEFLESRGKFMPAGDLGFQVNPERVCKH